MLGVEMSPVPGAVQEREGLNPHQGVYVQSTFPDTAAQAMGIQSGDVITQINGRPIASMTDLRNEVGLGTVGEPVDVTVQRNGHEVALNAPLQPWPASIPKQPIDPQAEDNFRKWQDQRHAEQQQQVQQLAEGIAELQQDLPQLPDQATQQRIDALAARMDPGGRHDKSWRLSAALDNRAANGLAPRPLSDVDLHADEVAAALRAEAPVAQAWTYAWPQNTRAARPGEAGATP
jgi:membrane-associated protease RseP (regulator of RpoE activity)